MMKHPFMTKTTLARMLARMRKKTTLQRIKPVTDLWKTEMLIIHPDGREEQRSVELPPLDYPSRLYSALKAKVEEDILGDWMEHVTVFSGFNGHDEEEKYRDMFVDENGKLKGLPINLKATKIYMNNTKVHNIPAESDFIVGIAVLFKDKVWV